MHVCTSHNLLPAARVRLSDFALSFSPSCFGEVVSSLYACLPSFFALRLAQVGWSKPSPLILAGPSRSPSVRHYGSLVSMEYLVKARAISALTARLPFSRVSLAGPLASNMSRVVLTLLFLLSTVLFASGHAKHLYNYPARSPTATSPEIRARQLTRAELVRRYNALAPRTTVACPAYVHHPIYSVADVPPPPPYSQPLPSQKCTCTCVPAPIVSIEDHAYLRCSNLTFCSGLCYDLSTTASHCGSCTVACSPDQTCCGASSNA